MIRCGIYATVSTSGQWPITRSATCRGGTLRNLPHLSLARRLEQATAQMDDIKCIRAVRPRGQVSQVTAGRRKRGFDVA